MKAILFSILLAGSLANAAQERGGINPYKSYEKCSGTLDDGREVNFEIRSFTLGTIIDSVLVETSTQETIVQLFCEKTAENKGVIWNCGETELDGSIDGGTVIQVTDGVVKTAQIFDKQMYPLPAISRGTLFCN